MDVAQNKFLKVKRGVMLNEVIEPVIAYLDFEFEAGRVYGLVTRGESGAEEQLEIIRDYAATYGIQEEFPEIISSRVMEKMNYDDKKIYTWQRAWSRLLHQGIIISPPMRAVCLFDYLLPSGENMKGKEMGISQHFFGKAFDIESPSCLVKVMEVLSIAIEKKLPGLKSFSQERAGGCLHINCEKVNKGYSVNI